MSSDVKPFVVLSADGTILAMLQTNEKGYKKSIENSLIWAVNPDTGRLLPVDDYGPAGNFSEHDGWYQGFAATRGEKGSPAPVSRTEGAFAGDSPDIINRLYAVIRQRKKEMPEGSYTTHLFSSGMSKIRKKTGEEAVELLLAESKDEMIYEAADLIYHMLVMLAEAGIVPDDVFAELERRE